MLVSRYEREIPLCLSRVRKPWDSFVLFQRVVAQCAEQSVVDLRVSKFLLSLSLTPKSYLTSPPRVSPSTPKQLVNLRLVLQPRMFVRVFLVDSPESLVLSNLLLTSIRPLSSSLALPFVQDSRLCNLFRVCDFQYQWSSTEGRAPSRSCARTMIWIGTLDSAIAHV